MKEDTRVDGPWEFGSMPINRNSKTDWEKVFSLAKEGDIDSIPADIRVRHYSTLKKISKDHLRVRGEADNLKGEWYCGPSGIGKSRLARDMYPNAYPKLANKWWDGYNGEDHVLLEDLDDKHTCLAYHVKLWADRYHAPGETKGGICALTHSKFVVTSQYYPEEIFSGKDLEAINRRFIVTRLIKL